MGRRQFTFRFLLLCSIDAPEKDTPLSRWHEDSIILESLATTFQEGEIQAFNFQRAGAVQEITEEWDRRLLGGIKEALRRIEKNSP